jgi:precorrin-6B methylase 2
LNKHILDPSVQRYLRDHLKEDVHRIAMSKSPFPDVSAQELTGQIAAKLKAERKLPTWFRAQNIYYPPLLSIEQCSSETTAAYKASLIKGEQVLDLTGGFGVDSFFFAKKATKVTHCELMPELSGIAAHNANQLGVSNISFFHGDGIDHLQNTTVDYSTIYIDPARRGKSGKVFMLKDCSPNVIEHLEFLLSKASRVIIKTSPLLDITAGIRELKNVSEVQIISTRNECKELLFILDAKAPDHAPKITSIAINDIIKKVTFGKHKREIKGQPVSIKNGLLVDSDIPTNFADGQTLKYLYEPDVALLKSGAFNEIASIYNLIKLDTQTQLFTSDTFNVEFPGRIFSIEEILSKNDLRKKKALEGNVIVRNYPAKPEDLQKSFKIKSSTDKFLIFTKIHTTGYVILRAQILQYY